MPEPATPRLPLPGMLRDGPAPRPADFREAPRARPSPSTVAAMAPPKGVIAPPRPGTPEETELSRLKPGNTAAFMAEVAAELMQQEDAQGSTIHGVAVEIMDDEEAGAQMSAAGLSLPSNSPTATPQSITDPIVIAAATTASTNAQSKRRGVLLGLGITSGVGLLLLLWFGLRESPPTPTPADPPVAVDEPPAPGDRTSEAVPTGLLADRATPRAASTGPASGVAATLGVNPTTGALTGSAGDPSGTTGDDTTGDDTTGDDTTGDDTTGDDTTGAAEGPADDGAEPVASTPSPRSPSRSRNRGKDRPKPKPTPKPTPKPKPKPEAPPDAAKLLTQARAAYNGGRHSSAYALASRSHRARKSSEAAELMTLAACGMKNTGKAKASLKKVSLLRRGSVRSKCKSKHGVKVGI